MRGTLILAAGAILCYGAWGIADLGFYHDDWTLLCTLHFAPPDFHARLLALLQAFPFQWYRPLDLPLWTALFGLFGLEPLGWQAAMLTANFLLAALAAALLRAYRAPPRLAVLGGLLFLSFPNKDATLFWPIDIVVTLSLALCLSAYLLHLRYQENGRAGVLGLSVAALAAGLLFYDQCAFFPLLWPMTPDLLELGVTPRLKRSCAAAAGVFALFLGYKLFFVPHVLKVSSGKTLMLAPLRFFIVYAKGLNASCGPKLLLAVGRGVLGAFRFSPPLACAALALPWLVKAERFRGRSLMILGGGLFILGYLPLVFTDYNPTAVNHQNRLNLAASLGLVLILAAAGTPRLLRALCALTLTATLGFSRTWAESARRQEQVKQIIQNLPRHWPAGSLLLLKLPERYVDDKAPVFDAPWDFRAAARLWTEDPSRSANVISPRMTFGPEGVFEPGEGLTPYASISLLDAEKRTISTMSR